MANHSRAREIIYFAVLQVVKYTGHTQSKKKKKNRKECCLPRYNQIFTSFSPLFSLIRWRLQFADYGYHGPPPQRLGNVS